MGCLPAILRLSLRARTHKGLRKLPLGHYECSFLPCTFWLATAYAKAGNPAQAEKTLDRIDRVAPDRGLLAEGIDPRNQDFAGNTPLLFSMIEYVRAVLESPKHALFKKPECSSADSNTASMSTNVDQSRSWTKATPQFWEAITPVDPE